MRALYVWLCTGSIRALYALYTRSIRRSSSRVDLSDSRHPALEAVKALRGLLPQLRDVRREGDRGDQVAAAYPLERLGEPADVAAAALFLAHDTSSGWITGQTLILDGGGIIGFKRVG